VGTSLTEPLSRDGAGGGLLGGFGAGAGGGNRFLKRVLTSKGYYKKPYISAIHTYYMILTPMDFGDNVCPPNGATGCCNNVGNPSVKDE